MSRVAALMIPLSEAPRSAHRLSTCHSKRHLAKTKAFTGLISTNVAFLDIAIHHSLHQSRLTPPLLLDARRRMAAVVMPEYRKTSSRDSSSPHSSRPYLEPRH